MTISLSPSFGMLEMVARIKAVLRRCAAQRPSEDEEEIILIGCLEVNQLEHTVSVADTGMGIPGSELPHIFERFYRVDRSRHKAIEGTGLGLSIVKHGVGFHCGSIRVVSTVGQGTEFIMKFPKPKYEAKK